MISITGSLHIYTEGNFIYCTNRILQWPSKGRRDTQRRPVLVRNSSYPQIVQILWGHETSTRSSMSASILAAQQPRLVLLLHRAATMQAAARPHATTPATRVPCVGRPRVAVCVYFFSSRFCQNVAEYYIVLTSNLYVVFQVTEFFGGIF